MPHINRITDNSLKLISLTWRRYVIGVSHQHTYSQLPTSLPHTWWGTLQLSHIKRLTHNPPPPHLTTADLEEAHYRSLTPTGSSTTTSPGSWPPGGVRYTCLTPTGSSTTPSPDSWPPGGDKLYLSHSNRLIHNYLT